MQKCCLNENVNAKLCALVRLSLLKKKKNKYLGPILGGVDNRTVVIMNLMTKYSLFRIFVDNLLCGNQILFMFK